MSIARGDTVTLAYTCRLEDGTVIEQSSDDRPLVFTVGEGKVIRGMDTAVLGMSAGEHKTVALPPEEAYGEREETMLRRFSKSVLPEGFDAQRGMAINLHLQSGASVFATIVDVTDREVVVDLNHPLAGRTLVFDITVLDATKNPSVPG